jgi:transposase
MWTPTTRRHYSRDGLRYDTDLTDAEWALLEPHMPEPCACGRPREWPLREVMNAIFYVLRGGIAWRLLPSDLPPKSTTFRWFSLWRDTGLFETINHLLVMADRRGQAGDGDPHHGRDRQKAARSGRLRGSSAPLARRALFAWISRNRRLWRDPEATLASAKAFLYAASVLIRRLARAT